MREIRKFSLIFKIYKIRIRELCIHVRVCIYVYNYVLRIHGCVCVCLCLCVCVFVYVREYIIVLYCDV